VAKNVDWTDNPHVNNGEGEPNLRNFTLWNEPSFPNQSVITMSIDYGDWKKDSEKFGDREFNIYQNEFYQRAKHAASVIGKEVRIVPRGQSPDIQVTFDTSDFDHDGVADTTLGKNRWVGKNDHGSYKSELHMYLDQYELNSGRLVASSNEPIESVFQHEFLHALGYREHSTHEDSIMGAQSSYMNLNVLPKVDQTFLRTIYDLKQMCVPSHYVPYMWSAGAPRPLEM